MIHELMEEITEADVSPKVFRLSLVATDHTVGFEAVISFRTSMRGASSLAAQGDTPEEALTTLRDELVGKFGKCEHCGGYRTGETAAK